MSSSVFPSYASCVAKFITMHLETYSFISKSLERHQLIIKPITKPLRWRFWRTPWRTLREEFQMSGIRLWTPQCQWSRRLEKHSSEQAIMICYMLCKSTVKGRARPEVSWSRNMKSMYSFFQSSFKGSVHKVSHSSRLTCAHQESGHDNLFFGATWRIRSKRAKVAYHVVLVGVCEDPEFLPDVEEPVTDVLVVGVSLSVTTNPGNVLQQQYAGNF